MARKRSLEERLLGAAVLKRTFQLSAKEDSPEFRALYPGVLADLELTDAQVDDFLHTHSSDVEPRARQAAGKHVMDA